MKVIHGNAGQLILYSAVMYWPLSTQAAASLASPFLVVILAYLILREVATVQTVFFLSLTLAGACMIVFNASANAEDNARIAALGSASVLAYIVLFGLPLS